METGKLEACQEFIRDLFIGQKIDSYQKKNRG